MNSKAHPDSDGQELHQVDVLVSGGGSNLRALVAHQPQYQYRVRRVIADRQCRAIEWAVEQGLEAVIVDWQQYRKRDAFTQALIDLFSDSEPAAIVCAGFMRIIGDEFFAQVKIPMLNIHPSLLPLFKGLHPQQQALDAGVRVSGATVHFMVPDLDAGPIVDQRAVAVEIDDDAQSLADRILVQEHLLYAQCVHDVVVGRVKMAEQKAVWTTRS